MTKTAAAVFLIALLPAFVNAQSQNTPPTPQAPPQNPPTAPTTFQDTVQVTATRFGEPVAEVPGSISVITGDEIRARGATDLRTAPALISGVSVAPGGDAGPAAAVPGLIGVREVDDLLLLIDGIPAGGAFIPQFEAISLNNVERIEVMLGDGATRPRSRVRRPTFTAIPGVQDVNRLTGSVGATWRVWQHADSPFNVITLHGNFFVDFYNQPVAATANGVGVLRSIGKQRYKGIDVEGALHPIKGLTIKANVGWSDARYEDYVTDIDGTPTQLAGNYPARRRPDQ